MGSALERHAEGEGPGRSGETARELAACRTGSPGARSTTPPSPNTWPPGSTRSSGTGPGAGGGRPLGAGGRRRRSGRK